MSLQHISDEMKRRDALKVRVHEIIVEHLGLDENELTDDANLVRDLGADSLDVVELAMALEEEFNIPEISDDDAEAMPRVRDVVAFVQKNAREKQVEGN